MRISETHREVKAFEASTPTPEIRGIYSYQSTNTAAKPEIRGIY
jgi:hypothetical protein